jgi:MOSC domain-containing protein YiiM
VQDDNIGRVVSIALRTQVKGPMQEVEQAEARFDEGLTGDVPSQPHRSITFISAEQWHEVVRELGVELPWHTRRANVLVEGLRLADLIGRRIGVGEVEVTVNAETTPCGYMDELHPGLRDALSPDCRAGVYGRITKAGEIKIGDRITMMSA